MADTAVDTSVLLDVLLDDPEHAAASARALDAAARRGSLVIGPATLAELATVFARRRDPGLTGFLDKAAIRATDLAPDDAVAAGQAFARHLARRPATRECPACGAEAVCQDCGRAIPGRTRIATDFLIAAHARQAGVLLTRDGGLRMAGVKVVRPR